MITEDPGWTPAWQRPGAEADPAPAPRSAAGRRVQVQAQPLAADPAETPPAFRGGWLARRPAWPIVTLLAGYPVLWALGFGDYSFIVMAVPMGAKLIAWRRHRSRPIRVPSGFGIWLLFLVCMLAGVMVLSLTAPETVASAGGTRVLSYAVRALSYISLTVLLLYAGNLTEDELPRDRLAWLLGLVALYTIAGGIGGMVAPSFSFSSPILLALPHGVSANAFVQAEMRPSLAQVQDVIGAPMGRPDAPFDYTNTWGNCLALLLPWLICGWWLRGSRRQRILIGGTLVIALAPIIYSLNRGMWIGLIFGLLYLGVRLAARGKLGLLGAICTGLVILTLIVLTTPLQGVIGQRLANGKSNSHRASASVLAARDALSSPIVGYGDTRHMIGSDTSIAIGHTAKCPTCGQQSVGNNGQLWLLLITTGYVGAILYLSFFGFAIWRYWRDRSPTGMAGVLALLLSFIFMLTYDAVGAPLGFMMLSYAVLWRNELARREAARSELGEAGPWPARTLSPAG
jgi:hypothetical protein